VVLAAGHPPHPDLPAQPPAHGAIRTLFLPNVLDSREADKRFLAQLQAQEAFSWVAFAGPNGDFFASHKIGDLETERRTDRYIVVIGDIQLEERAARAFQLSRRRRSPGTRWALRRKCRSGCR
jgi:hypothetical protein